MCSSDLLRPGGDALDEEAFVPLLDHYAAAGLDGVLAFGTNGEGVLLSVEERRRGLHCFLDAARGRATVAAGTSLDDLMRWLLPEGFFLVTPGTRSVTVGGAIASDIHGKGHHADGTFGSNVRAITLVDGTGAVRRLTPEETPEEFWATTGGMGLTCVKIGRAHV